MYRISQREYNTPGIFDTEDEYAHLTDQEWKDYVEHHVSILTKLILDDAALRVGNYINSIFTHPKGAEFDFVKDIINKTQERVINALGGEYWEQDVLG